MSFYEFIIKHQDHSSELGKLAYDIYLDKKFPTKSCDLAEIETYINENLPRTPGNHGIVSAALDRYAKNS